MISRLLTAASIRDPIHAVEWSPGLAFKRYVQKLSCFISIADS